MSEVSSVRFFPLKGGKAFEQDSLAVNTNVGVVNDRRLGIRRHSGDVTARPEPFKKGEYHVCANNPAMATQFPNFVFDNLDTYELASAERLERVGQRIGAEGSLLLHDTRGAYHLCDTSGPQVSFLNLATLRAFEKFAGVEVGPDRFRMNVWIAGLPAFAEYDWVDKYPGTREIMVGDVRMRIDDACERCKAPHANPKTGEFDLNVVPELKRFMDARGYKSPHRGISMVMGVYGVVLSDGVIRPGDQIRLV